MIEYLIVGEVLALLGLYCSSPSAEWRIDKPRTPYAMFAIAAFVMLWPVVLLYGLMELLRD